jgi:TetR/AcrR family transcriptional regulator
MTPPRSGLRPPTPLGGGRRSPGRAGSAASAWASADGGDSKAPAWDGARKAASVASGVSDPGKGQIRQANEALILGAGERVFARAGFNGATMAEIAELAGLPKANLHYYFGSKDDLYRAVLARTLHDWLVPLDSIVAEAEPRAALESYIRAKMAMSVQRPDASRVFANEVLHGAPVLGELMRTELRTMVRRKTAVIDGWIAAGRMAAVDATHLFFTIWAATQTYADFDAQVRAVLGRETLGPRDQARAADHVVGLILRGCGL